MGININGQAKVIKLTALRSNSTILFLKNLSTFLIRKYDGQKKERNQEIIWEAPPKMERGISWNSKRATIIFRLEFGSKQVKQN
jgi:hypothetical protein